MANFCREDKSSQQAGYGIRLAIDHRCNKLEFPPKILFSKIKRVETEKWSRYDMIID